MYLLDTNVISELRKAGGGRADAGLSEWALGVDRARLFVSTITIFEIERGLLQIERRDSPQGLRLRAWFDRQVLAEFAGRTLPVDVAVARRCARLHVPDPRPHNDALIAATALVHSMTLVTRNARDFQGMGVTVLNPWLPR